MDRLYRDLFPLLHQHFHRSAYRCRVLPTSYHPGERPCCPRGVPHVHLDSVLAGRPCSRRLCRLRQLLSVRSRGCYRVDVFPETPFDRDRPGSLRERDWWYNFSHHRATAAPPGRLRLDDEDHWLHPSRHICRRLADHEIPDRATQSGPRCRPVSFQRVGLHILCSRWFHGWPLPAPKY